MVCIIMLGMWSFGNELVKVKLAEGPGFECFFPWNVLYSAARVDPWGGGDCLFDPREWSL